MSVPLLIFGYDIPPYSIFERLGAVAMIMWVNIGAATLTWLLWELSRRGVRMVWKEREA